MTDTNAVAEIGYLMWCFNQGYGLAEDRAILTGGNWLLTDDSLLHEDDVRDKYQLLDLAADLYAAVAPVIGDSLREQVATLPYRHSPGGVRLLERDRVLGILRDGESDD